MAIRAKESLFFFEHDIFVYYFSFSDKIKQNTL